MAVGGKPAGGKQVGQGGVPAPRAAAARGPATVVDWRTTGVDRIRAGRGGGVLAQRRHTQAGIQVKPVRHDPCLQMRGTAALRRRWEQRHAPCPHWRANGSTPQFGALSVCAAVLAAGAPRVPTTLLLSCGAGHRMAPQHGAGACSPAHNPAAPTKPATDLGANKEMAVAVDSANLARFLLAPPFSPLL